MDALKREAPDEEALRKIFEEMEFRTLMDRVLKTEKKIAPSSTPLQGDLFGLFAPEDTDASKNSNLTRLEDATFDYQLIDTEEKQYELLQNILTKEIFSLDTETTGTDAMSAELVGMSFSYAENQAFYVPVPANREKHKK